MIYGDLSIHAPTLFEPPLLNLLSKLIETCDTLANKFKLLSNGLVSSKPILPNDYIVTLNGRWYQSISDKTKETEVDEKALWLDQDQKDLDALNKRLKLPDVKAEAEKVKKSKIQVGKLISGFSNWQSKLSKESCSEFIDTKNDHKNKQIAATAYAKSIFESSPLSGIGEEVWSLMWEQARAYSTAIAYPEVEYPNLDADAVCVLCQQPLDENAKKRFSGFESFVKGKLELAAKNAKKILINTENELRKTPDEELISSFVSAAGLDESLTQKIASLRNVIVKKAQEVLKAEKDEDLILNTDFSAINDLEILSEGMQRQIDQLDKDAEKDRREELKNKALNLEAKKWLSQQKEGIKTEIKLLQKQAKFKKAKSLISTTALTKKKSTLADELVSAEYIQRFQNEVENLGAGRINAKLEKTRSSKGKVYFQIKLIGNRSGISIEKILSEGEFRIISIAAFLADVQGHNDKSTFIFDDPISSLDQDYEEKVAERLVTLSETRQVLVFTHRLSLMALLDELIKKKGLTQNTIGLYKEPWGTGEPGLPPIHAQKTKAAINTLIGKIPEGKKILEEKGNEAYSWWAKSICSNTRITIEKVVEFDLLADVVQRFRRPINTQGKLINIAKVTEEDCHYIDNLMTKYSHYEHSQPNEITVPLPIPDELESDLNGLKSWREIFTQS